MEKTTFVSAEKRDHIRFSILALVFLVCGGTVACSVDSFSHVCVSNKEQHLVGGAPSQAEEVAIVLIRDDRQAPVCTGVQLTRRWALTAKHCVDAIDTAIAHADLDLALVPFSSPLSSPLPVFLGDVPQKARVIGYNTNLASPTLLEVEHVVEFFVEVQSSSSDFISVNQQEAVPSTCEGDSGSGLFIDTEMGVALLGVMSNSSAAEDAPCTIPGGRQYWTRVRAGLDWIESILGPCDIQQSSKGPFCRFSHMQQTNDCEQ